MHEQLQWWWSDEENGDQEINNFPEEVAGKIDVDFQKDTAKLHEQKEKIKKRIKRERERTVSMN